MSADAYTARPSSRPERSRPARMIAAGTPPHSHDAECDVLAACLSVDRESAEAARAILQSDDAFYDPRHAAIYRAILAIAARNEPADMTTVYAELGRMGARDDAGGAAYLSTLGARPTLAATAPTKARIVAQHWMKRQAIDAAQRTLAACYDDASDAFAVVDDLVTRAMSIADRRSTGNVRHLSAAIDEALVHAEAARMAREEGRMLGITTGLTRLDRILGGLQPTNHTVIGARPSMGKTSLMIRMARGCAMEAPGLIFSLEMASKQIAMRALAAECGASAHGLFTGDRDDVATLMAAEYAIDTLRSLPIYIEDTSALTMPAIAATTRRMMKRHGVRWVFVDYLGLVKGSPGAESRKAEIAAISSALKSLAKSCDIPVVSLVQLNRDGAKGTRPSLANIADADEVSRDADAVVLLHRPEYYGTEIDDDGNSTKGIAELVVDKNRNGPTDVVRVAFLAERTTFENLDPRYDAPANLPTHRQPTKDEHFGSARGYVPDPPF